jgi:hypothetical protein
MVFLLELIQNTPIIPSRGYNSFPPSEGGLRRVFLNKSKLKILFYIKLSFKIKMA